MESLSQITQQVQDQNSQVAARSGSPPPANEPTAPLPETAKTEPIAAEPTQPAIDKKTARKEKLSQLRGLASETQQAFVERQKATQARAAADAEVSKMRAEIDRVTSLEAEITKDPLAFMQKKGIKLRTLAERVAKGDDQNAETKALVDRIEAMEKQNETLIAQLREREESAKRVHTYESAKGVLLKEFDSGKEIYPSLHASIDGPEELVAEFLAMCRAIAENPETAPWKDDYSQAEILEALESKFARRAERVYKKKAEAKPEERTASQPKPTLTTRGASEAATTLPTDFKKLPEKQQTKILADLYRQMRQNGSGRSA